MTESALVPVQQQQVTFYDDLITVVKVEIQGVSQVFVPISPLCDSLKISSRSQRERIDRDPVLRKKVKNVIVLVAEAKRTSSREMLALPLDYLNGWLFGISAERVKDEEVKATIMLYQEKCYQVLAEAFRDGRLTTTNDLFDDLLNSDSPAVQAYKMAQAVMKMAQQQIVLETKLNKHTEQITDHERRLELVETVLGDNKRFITESQASQLSQAVKSVAMALGKQTKRNEYGGVYGEMYRRFGISSYKALPASKFDEAMEWLTEWLQSLVGNVPF